MSGDKSYIRVAHLIRGPLAGWRAFRRRRRPAERSPVLDPSSSSGSGGGGRRRVALLTELRLLMMIESCAQLERQPGSLRCHHLQPIPCDYTRQLCLPTISRPRIMTRALGRRRCIRRPAPLSPIGFNV